MNIIVEGKHNQAVLVTLDGKPVTINAGETKFTDAIICPDHDEKALSYRVNSDGIPNISIFMEECHVEPKDNDADDRCVVVEGGKVIVDGLIDTKQHHTLINPLPLKAFRFRIEEHSQTAPLAGVELIISIK